MDSDDTATQWTVFFCNQILGWSRFEHGDPPMGFVYGLFEPEGTAHQMHKTLSSKDDVVLAKQEGLTSYVIQGDDFRIISPDDTVLDIVTCLVVDLYPLLDEIHATVGITPGSYEEHFPHHIAAYDQRFS